MSQSDEERTQDEQADVEGHRLIAHDVQEPDPTAHGEDEDDTPDVEGHVRKGWARHGHKRS